MWVSLFNCYDSAYTAYILVSEYTETCAHRNQMSEYPGFWFHQINEAADSKYVIFGLFSILTNVYPISLSYKLVHLLATKLDQFSQIIISNFLNFYALRFALPW